MSIALTDENRKVLKWLRGTGRWANDSEIVRYGLHLVLKEVKTEMTQGLGPYSYAEVAKAYAKDSKEDRKMEKLLGKASARFKPGDSA